MPEAQVYRGWQRGVPGVDGTSLYIRSGAHIEVEIECRFFLKLTGAMDIWDPVTGEPDDWQFEPEEQWGEMGPGKHQGLRVATIEEFVADQPWLECTPYENEDVAHWGIRLHEGRHRTAWLHNHLHVDYMTIVIGFGKRSDPTAARDDIFINNYPGIEVPEEERQYAKLIGSPWSDGLLLMEI